MSSAYRRNVRGFTLVELLVTILVIGILTAVSMAAYTGQRNKSKNVQAKEALRVALIAARSYYSKNETYSGFNDATTFAEEESSLLFGNTAGDPMWGTNGSDTSAPGGAQVNPRRIRVYVYPGGQCINLAALSKGDMAYIVRDCQQPLEDWMYGGTMPCDFPAGTAYGSGRIGLPYADQEALFQPTSNGWDEDHGITVPAVCS